MPAGETVNGPIQVSNIIDSTQQISQAATFLNQQGSRVIKGSLQLIPVGNSIIYVRPFYVRSANEGGFPKFQFVAVFTQDKGAVCAPSIDDAITRLFNDNTGEQAVACTTELGQVTGNGGAASGTSSSTTTTTTTPGGSSGGTAQDKLARAATLFDQADTALKNGDLGQYQTLEAQARALVRQAETQLRGG
jgi:uncharacterized membrane protein (UPF0182 family)